MMDSLKLFLVLAVAHLTVTVTLPDPPPHSDPQHQPPEGWDVSFPDGGGDDASNSFGSLVRRSPRQSRIPEPFSPWAPLPWTCEQRSRWKILGESFFPSRLHEVECLTVDCWYLHYNCTAITYSVQVLTLCLGADCNDHRAPLRLRNTWRFVDVTVNVGCQCSR